MSDHGVARRYAKAFLELAEEEKSVDALVQELSDALGDFQSNDGMLLDALSVPMFTRDERLAVLEQVLPKLSVSALTSRFLRLLIFRGRFEILPGIVAVLNDAVDERAGRVKVRVTTAEPLTKQLEAEVRVAFEEITGKTVLLDTQIDPSLLGGLVARVGGKVYDASVRTRLEDLKYQLIHASTPAEA